MLIQRLARTFADFPRALAVLQVRIDRFTQVNEALGHATGEDVLRHVAARLAQRVEALATVARVADDGFAIALPGARAEEARLAARAVLDALRDPLEHELQPIDVAASIGVALFPDHGDDAESLLHCADVAVNAAQRAHVAIAFYEPQHEVARREHLSLIGELRRAVAESQLRAFYQPKIDLRSGRAVGAEALVRWRHPERGLLSPGHFMPFAEQTGYVRVLTRWMLAVTLRQCGLWAEAGRPLSVAVNISTRDLGWPELPAFIAEQLRAHAVPPQLVCLEVTEGVFMDDPEYALSAMHALRDLGVRLAIDDFGTGFSSLAYMKRMPVQELKLDAAFIKGMASSSKDEAIVRSTIQLAHSLGLQTVAEGVEDADTLGRLRDLGCDQAQGYFVARPMRRAALESWVRQRDAATATAAALEAAADRSDAVERAADPVDAAERSDRGDHGDRAERGSNARSNACAADRPLR
jgi:diguanylate cyclase (GGDEF)-like protein